MIDYSFLKLSDSIADAQKMGDSPIVTHYNLSSIQLLPDRAYLQITNFNGGISLDSDCEAFVVDCNDNVLADITDNVFIEEFTDSNGNNQCKIEYINLGVDFYRQTVQIKFDMLASDAVFYTNPINITAYQANETVYFEYRNYDDFKGIGYTNANVYQSISLRMWFDIPIDNTEVEDYFQISRENTISARALMKLFERYQVDYINRFTFDRLNVLLKHELIYLDGVRVTNKPVVSSEDREGDSNFFVTNFEVAKNYNDTKLYSYQIYEGFDYVNFEPSGYSVVCDSIAELNIVFTGNVTLKTGFISVYDSSDTLIDTFIQSDMSVLGNTLTVDTIGSAFENPATDDYYFYVSGGLVESIFNEPNEAIYDNTTWTLTVSEGDYASGDYSDDYLVGCSSESLGPELITNGDFSSSGTPVANSWALGWGSGNSGKVIEDGVLKMTKITSDCTVSPTNGVDSYNIIELGKDYKLVYEVVSNDDSADIRIYYNSAFNSVNNTVGTHTIYFTNTGDTFLVFENNTNSTLIELDNISLKEVL